MVLNNGIFTNQELMKIYGDNEWIEVDTHLPTQQSITNKLFEPRYIGGKWVTYITQRGMSITMYMDMSSVQTMYNVIPTNNIPLDKFYGVLCESLNVDYGSLIHEKFLNYNFLLERNGRYILNNKHVKSGLFTADVIGGGWVTCVTPKGVDYITKRLSCKLGLYNRLLNYINK